jgi:hypothetical protein
MVGTNPKTTWVLGYPLFERIHYLLVAGFDVYGNVGHQLATRAYMDFLRMESEFAFLALLPAQARKTERSSGTATPASALPGDRRRRWRGSMSRGDPLCDRPAQARALSHDLAARLAPCARIASASTIRGSRRTMVARCARSARSKGGAAVAAADGVPVRARRACRRPGVHDPAQRRAHEHRVAVRREGPTGAGGGHADGRERLYRPTPTRFTWSRRRALRVRDAGRGPGQRGRLRGAAAGFRGPPDRPGLLEHQRSSGRDLPRGLAGEAGLLDLNRYENR